MTQGMWVICGFTQRSRVDFHETFSPIVKLATFMVLSLALSYDLYIYLLDVKKIVHASFWRQCIVSNLFVLLILLIWTMYVVSKVPLQPKKAP